MDQEDFDAIESHVREMERVEAAMLREARTLARMTMDLNEMVREDRDLSGQVRREARNFVSMTSSLEGAGMVRSLKRRIVGARTRAQERRSRRSERQQQDSRKLAEQANTIEFDLERILSRFLNQ